MISFIILLKIYIIYYFKRCNVESFEYRMFLLEVEEKQKFPAVLIKKSFLLFATT